jgi:hypothetical protein
MTHVALSPLIGPEFDELLGAPISEDRNGTTLSVLSALARLDVDPLARSHEPCADADRSGCHAIDRAD